MPFGAALHKVHHPKQKFRQFCLVNIQKYSKAVIVDGCLALYRVRQAVERCRGAVRQLGRVGAAGKEDGGKG